MTFWSPPGPHWILMNIEHLHFEWIAVNHLIENHSTTFWSVPSPLYEVQPGSTANADPPPNFLKWHGLYFIGLSPPSYSYITFLQANSLRTAEHWVTTTSRKRAPSILFFDWEEACRSSWKPWPEKPSLWRLSPRTPSITSRLRSRTKKVSLQINSVLSSPVSVVFFQWPWPVKLHSF